MTRKNFTDYGKIFFDNVEIIRGTRFSHYLLDHENMLEIGAMRAVYLEMKEISDRLDELHWGTLYPIYQEYTKLRTKIKRWRRGRDYSIFKHNYPNPPVDRAKTSYYIMLLFGRVPTRTDKIVYGGSLIIITIATIYGLRKMGAL